MMQLALPQTRREAFEELLILEQLMQRRVPAGVAHLRTSIPAKFAPWLWSRSAKGLPVRYRGAKGGRGSAKSQTACRLLLLWHIDNPGSDSVCIREIQISLNQSVKKVLTNLIDEYGLEDFCVMDQKILTPGGGVIIFQGMQNHTAASIKSLEGFGRALVEEANTLSATSLEMLEPTIREPGSELWFVWNPESPGDPVDKLFSAQDFPDDAILVESNWQDNPHFPEVLRSKMERDYRVDPELALHKWGGQYRTRSEASVFKNLSIVNFETPRGAQFLLGGDWGFAIDPTAAVRMFIPEPRVLCIDREVGGLGIEIDDTPKLLDGLFDPDPHEPSLPSEARRWELVADSARPETISYLNKHGYPRVVAAKKGPNSVEEGVRFLQSFDVIKIHAEHCPKTAAEFVDYAYQVHCRTREVMPMLVDKKNHYIDAARYALEKVRKPTGWVNW